MNQYYFQHHQHKEISCISIRMLKVVMGMMSLFLGGYIVGPPLYNWHVSATLPTAEVVHHSSVSSSTCPPCLCDCSSDYSSLPQVDTGLNNITFFTDCMKKDPEVSREIKKTFTILLTEELKTREAETRENQRRADMGLLEAKKWASQFQKEADKCNSGMGTCEEAREKAEAMLDAQKGISALWELRARDKGWRSNTTSTTTRTRRLRRIKRRNITHIV